MPDADTKKYPLYPTKYVPSFRDYFCFHSLALSGRTDFVFSYVISHLGDDTAEYIRRPILKYKVWNHWMSQSELLKSEWRPHYVIIFWYSAYYLVFCCCCGIIKCVGAKNILTLSGLGSLGNIWI